MTNQGIANREEGGLSQAGLDYTRDQLLLLENFVKDVLRKDEDYGVIPGTYGKPSLLKPGAANVTAAFNCHAEPAIDGSILSPNSSLYPGGFVSYEAHVDLVSNKSGLVMARGFGNCNSYETKYRYRWEGRGEDRQRVVNEDPLEQANTIKKMAIKRAEVDAAMRLPGVARFFTQDLEDMDARSTASEKAAPMDNRYWCAEHRKNWQKHEKDGKVWYSHRQGTGWCNMKEAPIATQADLNDQATLAQDTPPAAQEATPAFTNLGEFYTWARTIGYPTVKDRMDVPGVAEAIEAKDYAKAAELLVAAKEQAKKAG